jgi:hypothetical protein
MVTSEVAVPWLNAGEAVTDAANTKAIIIQPERTVRIRDLVVISS